MKKKYATIALGILFVIVFILKDFFKGALYQDEHHYLPTAVFFSSSWLPTLNTLRTYNELNTPVPFVLGGWVINVFGESIQYLRILTAACSFILLMIFVWTPPEPSKRFWLCLGGLLFFPNYYLCTVYFYTDIFALLAVLGGVTCYVRRHDLAGMLCFILAISCRQYALAFPVAIVCFEVFSIQNKWYKLSMARLLDNRRWIFYTIAVLSILPWIALWGGLAPAKVMADQYYDSDKLIAYTPGFVLYASVCIAVYYVLPEMLVTRKLDDLFRTADRRVTLICIFIIGLLVVFFPAKQEYNPYFTWPYLGYVDQLLESVGIHGIVKQICFGMLALLTCMRFFAHNIGLASWMVIINILLLGKAQLSWDKYSLPLIMVLWYLALFNQYWIVPNGKEVVQKVTN